MMLRLGFYETPMRLLKVTWNNGYLYRGSTTHTWSCTKLFAGWDHYNRQNVEAAWSSGHLQHHQEEIWHNRFDKEINLRSGLGHYNWRIHKFFKICKLPINPILTTTWDEIASCHGSRTTNPHNNCLTVQSAIALGFLSYLVSCTDITG